MIYTSLFFIEQNVYLLLFNFYKLSPIIPIQGVLGALKQKSKFDFYTTS
ncbi:hypothetical protein MARI151_10288 [Maribacter litoralis]|uniref:Uncharacterized protein n=1 Tax=Maribacter litoralis TaxID=2059726 RepID=A0A653MBK8_9FLAO|nr:hypothetical protein MARI151_10288 [Maribacter litoralis]